MCYGFLKCISNEWMKPACFYPCFISYLYNPDPIMHWYDYFTSWPKLVKRIDRLMTWNERRIWESDEFSFRQILLVKICQSPNVRYIFEAVVLYSQYHLTGPPKSAVSLPLCLCKISCLGCYKKKKFFEKPS